MVVCLFKFGKLSTMKHTVASVPGRLNYYSIGDSITKGTVHVTYLTCILTITIHIGLGLGMAIFALQMFSILFSSRNSRN